MAGIIPAARQYQARQREQPRPGPSPRNSSHRHVTTSECAGEAAVAATVSAPTPAGTAPLLETIEERLACAALAHPHRLALATGMAGVLLMAARLAQLHPNAARAARVTRLAAACADAVSDVPMQSGLWNGVVGVLYAFEYVWSVDPQLLGGERAAIRAFVDDMDAVLMAALQGRPHEFDLVLGACGIGAYALMRTDAAAGRCLYAAAEQALERQSEAHCGGRAWRVPAHRDKPGSFDLGVAHGTPGVIGLLAHALRLGLGTARTPGMLDEALAWLQAQEDATLPHSRFASFTGSPAQSSRLAWCYGDLGVAAMLVTAATVRGGGPLQTWWQSLAARRIAQPPSTWLLADDALCHGRAGVLHILRRMQANGWHGHAANALAAALEQRLVATLASQDPGDAYGLLEGWAGVLLVLAEPASGVPAGPRPWHLCMLTPA